MARVLTSIDHSIDLWWCDLNSALSLHLAGLANQVLSPQERTRAGQIRAPHALVAFQCGRVLLRLLLGHDLGVYPRDVEILIAANGKPYVSDPAGMQFSLSHTSSTLVLATSRSGEIGVDVEDWHASVILGEDLQALAVQQFHRKEACLFEATKTAEEQLRLFLSLWTMREAAGKAAGIGISTPEIIVPVSIASEISMPVNKRLLSIVDVNNKLHNVIHMRGINDSVAALASHTRLGSIRECYAESLYEGLRHLMAGK